MGFEQRTFSDLRIVAEYSPWQMPARVAMLVTAAVTGLGGSAWVAWKLGAAAGGVALVASLALAGAMAWTTSAMHKAAMGRRVVLDGAARTLTFVRPMGFWMVRPGPDRVVPLDRVRSVKEMQSQGVCWLDIHGEDVNGKRVRLRIDSEMTNFAELWFALKSICGTRVYSPWYQSRLGLVALGVGIVVGIAALMVITIVGGIWFFGGLDP